RHVRQVAAGPRKARPLIDVDDDDASAGPRSVGAVHGNEGGARVRRRPPARLEIDAEGRIADQERHALGRGARAIGGGRDVGSREVLGEATGIAPIVAVANGHELLSSAEVGGEVHGELDGETEVVTALAANGDGIAESFRHRTAAERAVELEDAAVKWMRRIAVFAL